MGMASSENRGWELNAFVGVFLGLSWISFSTRLYVGLVLAKAFQADDWCLAIALGIWTATGIFIILGVHYGLGGHNAAALSADDEVQALKYQALATALYIVNMAFIKISIAFLLLRIAVQRRYIWILRIAAVTVALWSIAIFLFDIFQCSPVAFQWDTRIPGGKCVSPESIVNAAYSFSVLAVLSDWLFALIPIPMIWSVKLNRRTKVVVSGILSLGIFASIATLIRIKYLIGISETVDVLFSSTDAMIWTVIETGLGIIAASVVTFRPLLRAMNFSGFGSDGTSGAHGPNGAGPSGNRYASGNGYIRSVEMPEIPPKVPPKDGQSSIQESERGAGSENGNVDDILIIGTRRGMGRRMRLYDG